MELMRTVRINTRFSLLLQLLDAYTAAAPVGTNLSVMLEGISRKPLAKPDGCFVFTDLETGTYRLRVKSAYYLEEVRVIDLNETHTHFAVLNLSLKPAFSYPYFSGATCCLCSLRTDEGQKGVGIRVRATVLGEGCVQARLAQDVAAAGSRELMLNKYGTLAVGDHFRVQSKETGTSEYCSISAIDYQKNSFSLAAPLEHEYVRGDYFLPVMETRSDEQGEVFLYFRAYRDKHFKAVVDFFKDDYVVGREVDMEEGKMYNLGVVAL